MAILIESTSMWALNPEVIHLEQAQMGWDTDGMAPDGSDSPARYGIQPWAVTP